jgi:hypothetical protein
MKRKADSYGMTNKGARAKEEADSCGMTNKGQEQRKKQIPTE